MGSTKWKKKERTLKEICKALNILYGSGLRCWGNTIKRKTRVLVQYPLYFCFCILLIYFSKFFLLDGFFTESNQRFSLLIGKLGKNSQSQKVFLTKIVIFYQRGHQYIELNWPTSLACTTKDNSVKEVVSHHLRSVMQNVSYIHRRRLQFFKANDHVAF